jgi:hypothetical protein
MATFFLTAVGPIQHTKEGNIGREKTIRMTSLRSRGPSPWADGNFLSHPFPQNIEVSVYSLMWWH